MIYKFKGHEIELFDSVHELPILRFQRFNKYQMQAVQIGNTLQDWDKNMQRTIAFLKHDKTQEAIEELENTRLTVFHGLNEFTPQGKAFAIMVKRIDERSYNNFTPDELDRCLEHLERIGLSAGLAIEKLREVKKKSKQNFWCIIQNIFQKTQTKNKLY